MKRSTESYETSDVLIPQQHIGSAINVAEKLCCDSAEQAKAMYELVKVRLRDVNAWSELASLPISSFKLFDYAGRSVERTAQQGDFIRIDIPGPGTKTGKGYDWVVIESLVEETLPEAQVMSMRVRPSAHPLGEDENIAHFLKSCATSTFQVRQKDRWISAEEHGRNEVANLETNYVLDNIRNAIVGAAARIGFSYPQWKSLLHGLLATAQAQASEQTEKS